MKSDDDLTLQAAIAKRLRLLQRVAGATDQQMADYVGVSRGAWANAIALGGDKRNKPSEEAMVRLCELTGLTMEWVYRGIYDGVPYALAIALQEASAAPDQPVREPVRLPGLVLSA